MVRPPPTSTLFPYTTLFRSLTECHPLQAQRQNAVPGVIDASLLFVLDGLAQRPHVSIHVEDRRNPSRVDRKSTRLNSSHTVISYAVFCLKKKTITSTSRSNT